MLYPLESINVGDGLRTSRALNNGIIFTRAPKVRCTFNIMSPFPGEGGKGDGALRGAMPPLRQRYALPPLPKGEAGTLRCRRGVDMPWLPLWGSCHRR